jgi:putative transposase
MEYKTDGLFILMHIFLTICTFITTGRLSHLEKDLEILILQAQLPNETWITQQARQLLLKLNDRENTFYFLIHDNDRKFNKAFDNLFESDGFRIIHNPFHAPNANPYSEHWVRSVREECLDQILILNTAHLHRVLHEYVNNYYNVSRPHQGIEQRTSIPLTKPNSTGAVQRQKVLGGIINDYYRTSNRSVLSTI